MNNVLKTLAKTVLAALGLTAAASATDTAIQRKFGSGMRPSYLGKRIILIMSNEEINYIMKTINHLEDTGSLIKDFSET